MCLECAVSLARNCESSARAPCQTKLKFPWSLDNGAFLDFGAPSRSKAFGAGPEIGGRCANLDTSSFSLCCSGCAIDEISESREHLPVPGDCPAPSHDGMLPRIQHERSVPLNLDSPPISICQDLHPDPYSLFRFFSFF